MTMCKTMRALTASLAAAAIESALLIGPAAAGGSVSFTYVPQTAQDAQALRTGLGIYSIINGIQNGAGIRQLGTNNVAGIGQFGHGNLGIVHQDGDGHSGTLQQNGNANAYGLFQFGEDTDASVVQNSNGQAGATFQFGW